MAGKKRSAEDALEGHEDKRCKTSDHSDAIERFECAKAMMIYQELNTHERNYLKSIGWKLMDPPREDSPHFRLKIVCTHDEDDDDESDGVCGYCSNNFDVLYSVSTRTELNSIRLSANKTLGEGIIGFQVKNASKWVTLYAAYPDGLECPTDNVYFSSISELLNRLRDIADFYGVSAE